MTEPRSPAPVRRRRRRRQKHHENFWLRSYAGAPVWMIALVLAVGLAVAAIAVVHGT